VLYEEGTTMIKDILKKKPKTLEEVIGDRSAVMMSWDISPQERRAIIEEGNDLLQKWAANETARNARAQNKNES
jgi:hypothetical protein